MTNKYILGIDTSNYKTSIAITGRDKSILCDDRRFLTVKQGEKGLRQSDALFQHVRNLPEMLEEIMKRFSGKLGAVACSTRPRPVEGSYMPVFLAGESMARSIAAALGIPVFRFSHQEGHIEAVRAYSGMEQETEFLACHFSGGTSELLHILEQPTGYEIHRIGGSKDIAFGQVIDRAGVMMGMRFPAGQELDGIALGAETGDRMLTPIKVKDAWLNLSGIDTQMKRVLSGDGLPAGNRFPADKDVLIRELLEKLADAMAKMIIQGAGKTGIDKVLLAGGVTSSRFMRGQLSTSLEKAGVCAVFDEKDLAQDNAVGTALLGGKILWR